MNPPESLSPRSFPAAADAVEALNPAQREAVTHASGPLLVLAGAGSGKTRVITHRIAWLLRERRVDPRRVIAVTFTNKAAGEMRERVALALGAGADGMWIGTFHGLCLRMLRRHGEHAGLAPGFVVYDADDQIALVRRILREIGVDDVASSARPFLSRISRFKNAMDVPEAVASRAFSPDAKLLADVYARYEDGLRRANAADFDDLLLRALALVDPKRNPELAARYAEQCEHLLVDEYQDTNRPQYLLVRALSSMHRNVFVVGDEDQSIYRFRGAEIRNILDFERDHAGARVVKLEQNYRSTATILRAAGAVIAHNVGRKGKTLWTENAEGGRVELFRASDDRAEAAWIAGKVRELVEGRWEEAAVLYRTNAQSRQLEEVFRRDRIPYQVVGSVQFYERKEIKDLLAYLKLAVNPADDVAFRRVVGTPPRGIGETTLRTIEEIARGLGVPLSAAAAHAVEHGLVGGRLLRPLRDFVDLLDELRRRAAEEPAPVVVDGVIERIRFEAFLEKTYGGEAADRIDNVRALVSAAAEYEKEVDDPTLQGFLDRSALVSDADEVGSRPGVTLMTIHCAKGLEFPVVVLAGLEENLFPHARSTGSDEDLEEERRLCYVAMTRARERLLLTHAWMRLVQGVPVTNGPSRFLAEIPVDLVQEAEPRAGWDELREREVDRSYAHSSAARAARSTPSPPPVRRPSGPPPADGFAIGASVRHPMFGEGQITDREGSAKSLKLTIWFTEHGRKRILPSYTHLEVLGSGGAPSRPTPDNSRGSR